MMINLKIGGFEDYGKAEAQRGVSSTGRPQQPKKVPQ
jgi:hypothetical protein